MKNILIALILTLATLSTSAQIQRPMPPRSCRTITTTTPKSISIAPPPTSKAAAIHSKGRTYFGKLLPCDISFMEESTATDINGGRIYTLQLSSEGAYSIGIRTDGLAIADGSELYLYNNSKDDILGALTHDNQDATSLTRQIQGDTINIELFVPQGVVQKDFKITSICYDYANMFGKASKPSQSGQSSCSSEVNINCDEGAKFQDIKHAVVLLTIDDSYETFICTGTIVNNVLCDQTPYILTAAHCVCSDNGASNTVTYFNYESLSCNSSSTPNNILSMTGATIAATATKEKYTDRQGRSSSKQYPTMDFTLLKLKNQIPNEYQPYYAGLSLSETDNISSVATIHHPQGNIKKISIARQKPYQDSYPEEDNNVHYKNFVHWHIAQWDVGTTEGGSSGASLLNVKKQVIGILSGGYADCDNPANDFFQMLSKAWHPSSNPENQLQAHLAPNTHVKEILPFNPLNIGEKYLPAIVSAQPNSDSSIANLSWNTMQISTSTFDENFETLSDDIIDDTFIANVDMDGDRNAWTITTATDAHSGNSCITSVTTTRDNFFSGTNNTNDYLTLPKRTITTGDTLRFWAKSEGGVSTLQISQNTKPTRYKAISSLEIDDIWNEYKIPLDNFAGSSIYINISHTTVKGASTAVFIDDITIDSGKTHTTPEQTLSGYEVYCNDELIQSIADTATRVFAHHIERGKTYTYYILNKYEDGGTSNLGNTVTIDLDDTPISTATSELTAAQSPLVAYPNPTTGAIYITAPHNVNNSEIAVIDVTGRKVMSQKINGISKGEPIEISLAALRPGIYIIRMDGQSVKVQRQ